MNSTELYLVTFEQAKRLQAADFDWRTEDAFDDGYTVTYEGVYPREPIPRPTVALALKWMRDVKGFQCGVYPAEWGRPGDGLTRYFGRWFDLDCDKIDGTIGFGTYEAAESALLDELLKLI